MKKSWIIFFLLLLAAVARFVFLSLRPFDGDEGVILKATQNINFSALFAVAAKDVQPPLLHILEFVVLKILPFDEFSARLVSALSGTFLVIPVYFVFEKLSNTKVAFWVSLASIFSAVLGYHAAELRPYAFFTLIFFIQLYFFLKVLDEKKWLTVLFFALFTFFLIMTAYIGFVLIFGELLYVALKKRKVVSWPNGLSVILPFLLFGFFWGRTFIHQVIGRAGEQSQVLNIKANITGLVNALYRFGSGRLFLDLDLSVSKNISFLKSNPALFIIFVLSVIVPFVLFILGLVALYWQKREIFYFILILLAPIILAAAVSSEIGPRSARYLSFMTPFYLFIVINYCLKEKRKAIALSLGTIFMAIYLSSFVNQIYFERTKPGVNKIAEYLRTNAEDSDALVIIGGYGGGEELVARYYLKDTAQKLKVYDIYGDYSVGNLDEIKARKPNEFAKTAYDKTERVWLYDFTYQVKADDFLYGEVREIPLGRDKENKEIVLYEISRR